MHVSNVTNHELNLQNLLHIKKLIPEKNLINVIFAKNHSPYHQNFIILKNAYRRKARKCAIVTSLTLTIPS